MAVNKNSEKYYTDHEVAEKLDEFIRRKFPEWSEPAIAAELRINVPKLRYYLGRDKREQVSERKIPASVILNVIRRFPEEGEQLFFRKIHEIKPMPSEDKQNVMRQLKAILDDLDDRQIELLKRQVEEFQRVIALEGGSKKREK